jgi:hypothetical protein
MVTLDISGSLLQGAIDDSVKPKPTTTLYHYTSQNGLQGILSGKCIWASHVRHLNDLTEYSLAFKLAETMIESDESFKKDIPKLLTHLEFLRSQAKKLNVYVTSFTEHRNKLSQWRGYCQNGIGYNIGFCPQTLLRTCAKLPEQGITSLLTKCVYKESDIEPHISSSINILKDLLNKSICTSPAEGFDLYKELLYRFTMAIAIRAARLKHDGFEEECEWRIVVIDFPRNSIPNEMVGFHNGHSSLVPHVEIPLFQVNSSLELDEIITGPSSHSDDSVKSIQLLIRKHKISCPIITDSKIPFLNR